MTTWLVSTLTTARVRNSTMDDERLADFLAHVLATAAGELPGSLEIIIRKASSPGLDDDDVEERAMRARSCFHVVR